MKRFGMITLVLCLAALASEASATLLVHYKFDGDLSEVPSTGFQDNVLQSRDSANVANVPNANAWVTGVPGLGGQALALGLVGGSNVQWAGTADGTDADLGGLPSATDWTVEAFFQPKSLLAENKWGRMAVHWGSTGNQAYHLAVHNPTGGASGMRLNITTNYNPGGNQGVDGTTDLAVDTWYHAAAVKSGSLVTLYLNGIAEGSYAVSGNMTNSAAELYFGGTTTANPFMGYIDDVRIWNEAVSSDYLQDRAALLVPEPSSLALLLFGAVSIRGLRRRRK